MQALLDAAKHHPEKIIAFASVDDGEPQAPQILEQAVRDGARGLKLLSGHPHSYAVNHRPLDNPVTMVLFQKAAELRIPVILHISPGKFASQKNEFIHLVSTFPEVTVIAA
jgi:predicted TIM-barrel fold metal-dependent hydrolase